MKNVLLSIIVPIFNKAPFLKNCLESIFRASDMSVSEIILIDDGSQDESGSIADAFSAVHDNVIVYHTENRGVSAARNLGIKIANGKYITFVDADDEVISGSFTKVISYMNTNMDIFICGAVWGTGDVNKCDIKEDTILQITSKPVFDFFLTGGGFGTTVQNNARKYMWGCKEKFYKLSFITSAGIKFDERLSRNEDVLYSLDCYFYAKKFMFLPFNVYINLVDPNGLTSSMNMEKTLHNFENFFDAFNNRYHGIDKEKMALFCFQHTLSFLHDSYLALLKKKITRKKYNDYMTVFFSRDNINTMLESMPLSKLSIPKKVAFFFIKQRWYYLVGIEMDVYTKLKNRNIRI